MGTYDYIVVGAGSAGCVVANRLSSDASKRVLLLEAGGSDRKMAIRVPAAFAKQFRTDLDWNYTARPEPNLLGRSVYLPRGRSLGGSSSMNAMIYIRGHRHDYDSWAKEGAPGWSYDEVLPYFKRSEHNERIRDAFHGQGGPLNIADQTWTSPLASRFLASAAAMGIPANSDFNGAVQEGAGLFQLTQRRGRRWSAADAYLHPVRKRANLTIVTGAMVHRVVFEGRRATGVAYERRGARVTAHAAREVVLCAGAYNSPQLLMLSGIGPAGHLREVGVDPVVDHPHVGGHLQDHPLVTLTWTTSETDTLLDAEHPRRLAQYVLGRGQGKLASNVAEAGAHFRTRSNLPAPDVQLLFGAAFYSDNGFRTYPGHAFTIGVSYIRPMSEGSVRLRSADPGDPPAIRLGWLSKPGEIEALKRGIRLARKIAGTGPLSEAALVNIDPGPGVLDDDAIEAWVRAQTQVTYHPAGTCRMGSEGNGVLDERLRVRGVEGLRVADASVMPSVIGGNTNAACIMIGERAAEFALVDASHRLAPMF